MVKITTTENQVQISRDGINLCNTAKNSVTYNATPGFLNLRIRGLDELQIGCNWRDGITLNGEEITLDNVSEKFEALFI